MGEGETLGSIEVREKVPLFIPVAPKEKRTLSIFVDEGGDFGPADPHSPLYVVAFVFHDQSVDLKTKIDYLSELVAKCGLAYLH